MKLILHKAVLQTIMALLPFFSICTAVAQVTLPHYEGINYTAGSALQSQTGWTTLNTGDDLSVTTGSLSYAGLSASTANKVAFAGSGIDAAKAFTQQTSGTVYYSFIMNVTALGTLNTTGGYFTSLNEGTGTNFGATVWVRSDGAGYDIGINPRTTAVNTVWSAGTTAINTPVLVVISYQLISGVANDVVKMWINPTPGAALPTATLTATNAGTDLANVNRILIRQDSASTTPSLEMDELRVGLNWSDVTPSSGPVVTTNAASSITENSAILNGTVNANNFTADVTFDYGSSVSYGLTVTGDPSTLSDATTTPVTGTLSGLTPNTLIHFRTVGTVSGTPTNGADMTFYTLANVPNAPVVDNATINSLDVTINSTSENSNPANTLYTIQETGGSFVQADGSLGASPVQQTAAAWGTITVTGLNSDTNYAFHLEGFNGAGVPTGYGATATGSTLQNINANITLVNALQDFGAVCTNATATQSFSFDGNNLDGSDVVIGPLAGYAFSTSQNGTYTNTLNISYVGASLSNEVVWVQFSPTAVQSYNGNIPVSGAGLAATFDVPVTGSGVATSIIAITGSASSTTAVSSVLAGSINEGCTSVSAYGIEYSTVDGFVDGTGTSQPSIDLNAGAFTATVNGLEPNTTYYYKAFATDSNGTDYGDQQSFTTANIEAPLATDATAITENSFTANWDDVDAAASYRLDVSTSPLFSVTTPVSNLIISEYGEGSGGNKKYIEIYNGTGASVNLANYQLWKNVNGSNWNFQSDNITATLPLALSGTLVNGGTFVVANNSTDVIGADLYNTFLQFNGDDATGLAWNGGSGSSFSLIDAVGTAGIDPGTGWAVAGTNNATVDKILIRKPTVIAPNTNWTASAGTNATNSEWTVSAFAYNATNQTTNLGAHTMNNSSPLFVPGYEDLTVNGLSQVVSGLTENTNYYYRVRAVSTNSTSTNSNVVTVLTAPAAPTFGTITQIVGVVCEDTAATFNVTGLYPNSTSTINYDIDGGSTQSVPNVVANGSGFASFEIVLNLSNNGQTLTVTSVERTDLPGGTLNVTTENTTLLSVSPNTTWYTDADGDGYGSPTGPTVLDCTQPSGYSANNTDCNDAIAAVNPGAAEILYDGVDNNCNNQLDEGFQITTSLLPSVCGTTLASIGSLIGITTVSSAITGYRIRVTNGAQVQIIERNVPHFTLPHFPSYEYATTYTVEIELQRNGIWLGYYGAPCLVSSPAILAENGATQVSPSQCGITLARINTLIATTSLAGVTGYRFKVTNITEGASGPNVIQTIDRTQHWFSLPMLSQYNYGSTYRIEIAVKTNGAYSGFGAPCEVSSPASPTLINCGGVVATASTLVAATSVQGATQYRFQVTRISDNSATTIDRNINSFTFNMIPGYTSAAQYAVRVAVMTVGTWSPFGDACEITSPGTAARFYSEAIAEMTEAAFKAIAYPNPFDAAFAIDVTTSVNANVEIMVYDMTGRLIETRTAEMSGINALQIGENYPTGVYNVIVLQDDRIESIRVIKR